MTNAWDENRVAMQPLQQGKWMAVLDEFMAIGGSKREALRNLKTRIEGRTPKNERPYLKLCKPCNVKAAEAGDAAHSEGVEVCIDCAQKIDRWNCEMTAWQARQRRRRRKR